MADVFDQHRLDLPSPIGSRVLAPIADRPGLARTPALTMRGLHIKPVRPGIAASRIEPVHRSVQRHLARL